MHDRANTGVEKNLQAVRKGKKASDAATAPRARSWPSLPSVLARSTESLHESDAFFPFADGLQVLLDAGIRAVVHPGGSIRDDEVIQAAKDAGVTMYLTGTRHFFH